jgi:hypothetical protein
MSILRNYPGSRPGPHAASHGQGGTDPLDLVPLAAEVAPLVEPALTAAAEAAAASALAASGSASTATAQAVLADADRVQTGLDRVQTGLDRTQTGLDKAQTISDAAATAGDKAQTIADAAATAADRVQTGLDRTQTVADRVQTGLDRVQTGLDRTAASASASSAASSASTALNALALQYKGGVSGASVLATSTLAGDYYEITTAGTSQSKTWAVGDRATYNGSSGSWTQTTGFFTVISSALTAYSPQGYLNSDGATSNRAQIQGPFDAVNNPRGWVAGAAVMEWCGWVHVPTSAPSSPSCFIGSLSLGSAPDNTTTNQVALWLTNTGQLFITANGASAGVDVRRFAMGTFQSTYPGQRVWLSVILTQGTATNPVVKVNGTDISASFSLTTTGTPPAWLDAAMVPTYHLTGYNWPAGRAPLGQWILGSLTAAESLAWMITGQPPAWVAAGGSAVALITSASRNSDFSAGATDWTASGGSAVAVVGSQLQWSGATTGNGLILGSSFVNGNVGVNAVRLRLRFSVVSNAGLNATIVLRRNSDIGFSIALPASAGDYTATVDTANVGGGYQILLLAQSGSGTVVLDNIYLDQIGALSLPGIQPCAVVDDLTTIGGNQARLVGVTAVTPKRDWRISEDTWINGNQRILEGALIDSTADIIDTIEQTTTGTPTTTIGSASAGSQYKASGALTAGINPTTLVTRKAASNEFWVGSNSTAVVRTTIKGHRAI